MLAVVVVGAMSVLMAVLALVVLNIGRNSRGSSGSSGSSGPSGSSKPTTSTAPGTPTNDAPPTPGNKLPASCKITGDVFGNRPAVTGGVRKQNVYATYHPYEDGGYATSTLACADIIWKWPNYSQKVMQYPWTAFCLDGQAGWNPGKTCGKCFRVKNRATGAAVIVRAVDSGGCSGGAKNGLDLSKCAFNAIDTNGQGVKNGHMMTDVTEVAC